MKNILIFLVIAAPGFARGCSSGYEDPAVKEIFPDALPSISPHLNCTTENIDAATTTADGRTYFFKGDYYWRIIGRNVADGYPRLIRRDWVGLPSHLDAALTWPNGRTYFYKRDYYWGFHDKQMEAGYPKKISDGWCGIPDNIDAATTWSNGHSYFFKGDKYYRYEIGSNSSAPKGDISAWTGVPNNLDAATMWKDGVTYFIKDGNYYAYKDEGADTPVPLDPYWGLSCNKLKAKLPNQD